MTQNDSFLKSNIIKLIKFFTVGLTNCLVDFTIINLLFLLFYTENHLLLTLMSIISALFATINSFILNKYWTFNVHTKAKKEELVKFFAIAFLAMAVNTSIFLCSLKYLEQYFFLKGFWLINIAKLIAVSISMFITFFGYRFAVFKSKQLHQFKQNFTFHNDSKKPITYLIIAMVCLSIIVRLLYLNLTAFVFGDGVHYASVAQKLANGQFADIDTFWVNLFCYWQSLFYLLPISSTAATIVSTMIPGALLVAPIIIISNRLFNYRVAWIAALFTVFHPRLIEYSVNGYSESLYLFFLASTAAFLIIGIQDRRPFNFFLAGLSMGGFIAIRNEGILLLAVFATVISLSKIKLKIRCLSQLFIGSLLIIGIYMGISETTLNHSGMFQKISTAEKIYSEQLDPELAAKETYRESHPKNRYTNFNQLTNLAKRYPRNIVYLLERIPTIFLSPLILFALLLPIVVKNHPQKGNIILISIFIFPILFYPLIQLEARLLLPCLIPIHIWGSAAIVAISTYIYQMSKNVKVLPIIVIACTAMMLLLTIWRGVDLHKRYLLYQNLSGWIKTNIASDQLLFGDGYGYITNTGFLIPNPIKARQWVRDPEKLTKNVKDSGGKWLIVYEGFLKKFNPELLFVLQEGLPHAKKMYETSDGYGIRGQIYKIK